MINLKNWLLMKRAVLFGYNYDKNKIPTGFYCYTPIETPSIFNNHQFVTRRCPYHCRISKHSFGCLATGKVETWGLHLHDAVKICGINDEISETDKVQK